MPCYNGFAQDEGAEGQESPANAIFLHVGQPGLCALSLSTWEQPAGARCNPAYAHMSLTIALLTTDNMHELSTECSATARDAPGMEQRKRLVETLRTAALQQEQRQRVQVRQHVGCMFQRKDISMQGLGRLGPTTTPMYNTDVGCSPSTLTIPFLVYYIIILYIFKLTNDAFRSLPHSVKGTTLP